MKPACIAFTKTNKYNFRVPSYHLNQNYFMMKKIRLLAALIILGSLVSCVQAQFRKTVYGNEKVVREERQAGSFDAIKVSTGIDVYLRQGNREEITVVADENLQEYILTEIQGNVLNVYTEANIRDAKEKKVYVTMKDIRSVKACSAGDVIGESSIKTDEIEIDASSAGDIKLDLRAEKISVDISSSGDVTLSGDAERLEADLSSAGDFKASELRVKDADVSVSSAGDASIFVTESLKARASSAGDIHYSGNPKYVDAHSSSAGSVQKR
jgi:hypothetical protein